MCLYIDCCVENSRYGRLHQSRRYKHYWQSSDDYIMEARFLFPTETLHLQWQWSIIRFHFSAVLWQSIIIGATLRPCRTYTSMEFPASKTTTVVTMKRWINLRNAIISTPSSLETLFDRSSYTSYCWKSLTRIGINKGCYSNAVHRRRTSANCYAL